MDRRATRSQSSQGSHMSRDQPKNPLFQIDPTNFFERIKTEEEAIELVYQFDMLPRRLMDEDAKCMCGNLFDTKTDNACRPLGWRYWCENCGRSPSSLHGTIFNYSNRSVRETLKLILCFVAKYSRLQIVNACKVDEKTVTDWSKRCRHVMEVVNSNDFHKLK